MPVVSPLPAGPFTTGGGNPGADMAAVRAYLSEKGNATDADLRAEASAAYVLKSDGTVPRTGFYPKTSGLLSQLAARGYPSVTRDQPVMTGSNGPFPLAFDGSGGVVFERSDPAIRVIGGLMADIDHFGALYRQNTVNSSNGSGSAPYALETLTSSVNSVALEVFNPGGDATVLLEVDGRPVSRKTAAVGFAYLQWTWPDARRRHLRFNMGTTQFGRIALPALGSISLPNQPPGGVKLAAIGDSWFAGADEGSWQNRIPTVIGRLLGWEVFHAASGGSGYSAAGGFGPYGSAARINPIVTVAPNYVLIFGSINDRTTAPATVGAAASALYSRLNTDLPATKVIVVGPQNVFGNEVAADMLAVRDAVKTAALAASNVLGFVDPLAERWMPGAGTVNGALTGTPSDFYTGQSNLHPSRAGASYYAHRVVENVVRLLEGAGSGDAP